MRTPPAPRRHPRRPGRLCALVLLLAAGDGTAGPGGFQRTLSSGHVDFQRQVAVARGVGPRARAGDPDRAVEAARTNLKALLLPHPVDGEVTLGDLAAYHPDLGTAFEFQLAQASIERRNALPPDLEEVVVELDLSELVTALLPFLGDSDGAVPPVSTSEGSPPERIILELPERLAADHVPSLIPSIRGLGGAAGVPASGAWLRQAFQRPLVRYVPRSPESREGDWSVSVVSTGGLAGATLFLQDPDAERLRRILLSSETPEILVAPAPSEEPRAPARTAPPAPVLARLHPDEPRPVPERYRLPTAPAPAPSRAAEAPAPPTSADEAAPDFAGLLQDLRARLDEARPLGAPTLSERVQAKPSAPPAPAGRGTVQGDPDPGPLLPPLPEDAFLAPPEPPALPETAYLEPPARATPPVRPDAGAPRDGRMPPEVLEALPEDSSPDDGSLYGSAPLVPEGGPPLVRGGTWQEFDHPEDPEGLLWESFDARLSGPASP